MFALYFLHPVYLMLPVSQDCPFLISHSVFSNVLMFVSDMQQLVGFHWYSSSPTDKTDGHDIIYIFFKYLHMHSI